MINNSNRSMVWVLLIVVIFFYLLHAPLLEVKLHALL